MDKSGAFGEILEKGQVAADSVKKSISSTVKATATQVTGVGAGQPGQNNAPSVDKDFVNDLYGVKDNDTKQQTSSSGQAAAPDAEQVQAQKKIEDQQKLAKLRRELHQKTYYDPLVNPPKQQEERPAEKVEQEKKQEEFELQQKEKKKPEPLAVKRAQRGIETNRGVTG